MKRLAYALASILIAGGVWSAVDNYKIKHPVFDIRGGTRRAACALRLLRGDSPDLASPMPAAQTARRSLTRFCLRVVELCAELCQTCF